MMRLALLFTVFCVPAIHALRFRVHLPPLGRRCYFQDVLQNTLMVISAQASESDQVDLKVIHGETVIFQERSKPLMKTAFTSASSGDYSICIMNFSGNLSTVTLSVEQGPEAKDYTQVAKKEHLDPLVVSLRMVEDQLREYHKNLLHMRSKEVKMRRLNDSTSSQVVLFCMLSVGVMLVATVVQILYFRSFLRSKKII